MKKKQRNYFGFFHFDLVEAIQGFCNDVSRDGRIQRGRIQGAIGSALESLHFAKSKHA